MFRPTTRLLILKWGTAGVLAVSLLPVLVHGLLVPALPYYLQLGIIVYLGHLGYRTSKQIWHW